MSGSPSQAGSGSPSEAGSGSPSQAGSGSPSEAGSGSPSEAGSGSPPQAALGPQPDFNHLRQCQEQIEQGQRQTEQGQRGYFEEINKLQNVPAFNGDAILAAIERLGSRFDGVEQRLDGVEQRLDGIAGRLDVMDTRQQAAEHNSTVRIQNSRVLHSGLPLSKMHNPETNVPIARFPRNPREIGRISSARLNALLEELGVGTDGELQERRERLRVTIGLIADPA